MMMRPSSEVKRIDEQLAELFESLKTAEKGPERAYLMLKIDSWLDMRNRVTSGSK